MKKIYVSGKVWLDAKSFIEQYPQTKLPLVMLLADTLVGYGSVTLSVMHAGVTNPAQILGALRNPSIDQWTYNKKIETYRDIIRYSLSPEFPLTITFQPRAAISKLERGKGALSLSFSVDNNCKWHGIPVVGIAFDVRTLQLLAFEYLNEIPKSDLFWTAKMGMFKNRTYLCMKTYLDNLINEFSTRGFQYFEVKSVSEWREFNEIYGVSDIAKVPANTISYCVTGQPPPVPAEVNWQSVEMWSALFQDSVGTSILSAVVQNLPVKIKTQVTNWTNPNLHLAGVTKVEDKKKIVTTFTYVWQDFIIEVDAKNSMVVKYNRGMDSKDIVYLKEKEWNRLLVIVGFIAALATIYVAAGVLLPTAAPVAGGTATGASLTVPALTVPAIATPTLGVTGAVGAPLLVAPTLAPAAGWLAGAEASIVAGGVATGAALVTPAVIKGAELLSWAAVEKALPEVGLAVAKAGVGLWTDKQKAKIQEGMIKAGMTAEESASLIPDGKTIDGAYVKKPTEAGMFAGLDMKTLLLIGGGVAAVYFMTTGKTMKTKKGGK